MKLQKTVISVFAVSIAVFLVSYLLAGKPKAAADERLYSGDALITQSIEAKFFAFKETGGTSINVKTINGEVLLSGFAKSDEEKSAVEGIAHKVRGVKTVKNEVVVRP